MKILITTAKEMKVKSSSIDIDRPLIFENKYKTVVEKLKKYTVDGLGKLYKVKREVAERNFNIWQSFESRKKYKALELFNGLMYRYIEFENLDRQSQIYLDNNLRIISSLYGIIRPFDKIAEHRLDFSKNIEITNNIKLVNFWKEDISSYLLKEDSVFINLLSDEFNKVLNKEVLEKSIFIKFKEISNGKLKTHSTISKKGRGSFIKYMARVKASSIEDLVLFDYDGYKYDRDNSSNNELIFIKNGDK
ncbi:peroxide stress protein YaaA [Miniphocaeibacter halophilus]|uniref:Peroxide stress protein YaaA n=1 Tax=Miniphocaeibacter halophilus TaxID=2931922 RepID=A0AC61MN74_9FIRM|nr:peroxide stress protein YaaA [Miniphocaeibacter halophilus]QQK07044.1 peroxide stress protein YaaA [Miniphocaeibacter halophilus]